MDFEIVPVRTSAEMREMMEKGTVEHPVPEP
jgi:hypothetical protein